ncbi:MAG: GAF domain-containing protein [Candidatus Omnitrophica bacterium]|nr:GAF domain-containing protein [Candidatus Omnitrophota bacterium]
MPPFLNITASLGVPFIAYAILKYRLLDIRIAITRAGIFLLVYFPIVSLSFWFASRLIKTSFWWAPMLLFGVLTSLGIFIYNRLREEAEDLLLAEDRKAQNLLIRASEGMTQIRDLKKLLALIVHLITKTMKISDAKIWLWDKEIGSFVLKAQRFPKRTSPITALSRDDPLIQYLLQKKSALVYEEINLQKNQNLLFKIISEKMLALGSSVIVPSFMENDLLGFLVLDKRRENRTYTSENLRVFQTLANQFALALENCLFYALEKQQEPSRRLSSLDRQIDCMAHEIDNPFFSSVGEIRDVWLDTQMNTDF